MLFSMNDYAWHWTKMQFRFDISLTCKAPPPPLFSFPSYQQMFPFLPPNRMWMPLVPLYNCHLLAFRCPSHLAWTGVTAPKWSVFPIPDSSSTSTPHGFLSGSWIWLSMLLSTWDSSLCLRNWFPVTEADTSHHWILTVSFHHSSLWQPQCLTSNIRMPIICHSVCILNCSCIVCHEAM